MDKKEPKRGGPLGPHGDRTGGRPKGLAARLIAARVRRGLNQERAAAELGVSRSAWAAWELGTQPRGLYRAAVLRWIRREEG